MKKLIIVFTSILSVTGLSAQTTQDDYYTAAKPKLLSKDRVNVSLTAGTGLSFANNSTSFSTFIAPKINYQLTNKFRLNIGFMHYTLAPTTAFYMNRNESLFNTGSRSVSGNLVVIGGDYRLNKKMILSGAVMTDVNAMNNSNNSYKAASLGLEYKVTEHSSIKVETTISNGQGNYNNNNMNNSSNLFPSSNSMFSADPTNSWIR